MGKNRICALPWAQWLLCISATVALFAICYTLFPVFFMTNDDAGIMYALGGYNYTMPMGEHPFTTPWFAKFVSALYKLVPVCNWYVLLHISILFGSLVIISKVVLELCVVNKVPLLHTGTLLLLFFWLFCFVPVTQYSFTITPAVAGAAAIALQISTDKPDGPKQCGWARHLACVVLMLLCFTWRYSTGLCVLVFYLLAAVWRFWKLAKSKQWHSSVQSFFFLTVLGILILLSAQARQLSISHGNPELWAYNSAKAGLLDFPHLSYDEAPQTYETFGIQESLYHLIEARFSLDERLTTENLTALSQEISVSQQAGLGQRLYLALMRTYQFITGPDLYVRAANLFLLAFAAIFSITCFKKGRCARFRLLCMFCAFFLGITMLGYLGFSGRIVYRAYAVIAIPLAVYVLVLFLDEKREDRQEKKHVFTAVTGLMLMVTVIITGYAVTGIVAMNTPELLQYKADAVTQTREIEAYVLEHPDKYYIYDYTSMNMIDPFVFHAEKKVDHLISWGANPGDLRARQLSQELGVPKLTSELFLREDVYYITQTESYAYELLVAYMRDYYKAKAYRVATLCNENVSVFQFKVA